MLRRLTHRIEKNWFRWLVITTGGISLAVLLLLSFNPDQNWWLVGFLLVLFTALDAMFPLMLLGQELSFGQVVIVGTALLYSPLLAVVAGTGGMLLGYSLRRLFAAPYQGRSAFTRAFDHPFSWVEAVFSTAQVLAALFLAILLSGWRTGLSSSQISPPAGWQQLVGLMAIFAIIHSLLVIIGYRAQQNVAVKNTLSDMVMLVVLEFLPLPFILIAIMAYPQVGTGSMVALGALSFILALLMSASITMRIDLEHALDELATLNQISQVLRSSLELDNLLAGLQLQVRQMFAVDNFYIALYDAPISQLWYPMAVKHGKLVNWPSRPMMDRLTDRVIQESKALLLPHHAHLELERIGLPVGEEAPAAWMGVPLISSEQVIGCLGVFSFSPETIFSNADLNVLGTISNQVSVAIENTLLHEQVEQSIAQIGSVSQIASLIAGSLNSEEVLNQVCQSVVEVGGGDQSAIFLVSAEKGNVRLACSHGLPPDLLQYHLSASTRQAVRTRCLSSGKPELIGKVSSADEWLDAGFIQALQKENIQSIADFPMITSEGQAGYLSVYFNDAHMPDEKQTALLYTLAAQAALSVSSGRLHAESNLALARRAEQLSTLESVGRRLAAAIRSQGLFEQILDYAMEFTASQWGRLALYDAQNQILQFKALRGYPKTIRSFSPGEGICGRAIQLKKTLEIPDVRKETDYLDFTDGQARSHLSIPLIHDADVLGVLTLESSQVDCFSGSQLTFINQLADQAMIALVNANLYTSATQGRDRLEAVINSVHEGLLMVGQNGEIVLANPFIQKLVGLPKSELIDTLLPKLPDNGLNAIGFTPQEAISLVESLKLGSVPEMPKVVYQAPSGSLVLERSSSPVRGVNEQLVGWMALLRDVTEEHQLIQERELLTETLVHDLRSPMGAVLGSLEIIDTEQYKTKGAENDLIIRAVDVGRRGAQRVLKLVNSMLDIARWEAGEIEANLAPTHLGNLVEEVLAEYLPQAWDFGLELSSRVAENIPQVIIDRERIYRVLSNLVDNAIKYTPKGGSIVISTGYDALEKVTIRVSDTGPGIPEAYRLKIFERFRQVPDQQGRRRGSGLGLTFCKLAVEAHSGKIWVEESDAGGSEFVFTLPLNSQTPK
jgi:NtrC-family two-component system sensor histidine kinase KinB